MARKKTPEQQLLERLRKRVIEDLEIAILQVKTCNEAFILRDFSNEFNYTLGYLSEKE